LPDRIAQEIYGNTALISAFNSGWKDPNLSRQTLALGDKVTVEWWTLFRSPDLDLLVKQAITGSPTFESAKARLEAAREAVAAASSSLYPQVGFNVGFTCEKESATIFGLEPQAFPLPPNFNLFQVGTVPDSDVVIPGDVALKPAASSVPKWLIPAKPTTAAAAPEQVKALAALLNGSERVTLFCGAGCAGAHEAVLNVARALNAPIVHTLRGKEHIEYDKPFDVGMTGLVGFASGYKAMKSCEALLILGADFTYRQFFPEDARIAQIDLRPEALGNRCPLELGLLGEVGATLTAQLAGVIDDSH
jgi:hypothetical protein